jgi:hypothetical protein
MSTPAVRRLSQMAGFRMSAASLARQESTNRAPVLEEVVQAPREPAAAAIP